MKILSSQRFLYIFTLFFHIAILAYFKIGNSYRHQALPVGISFYTFQLLSFMMDSLHDPSLKQVKFIDYLLYISFFPQFVAGPIVKYHDIYPQLSHRKHDQTTFFQGVNRFILGFSKKIIIADTLAQVVDAIYGLPFEQLSWMSGWMAAVLYPLVIYYDFSGYSDMAVGLGKMFGFHFPENFSKPLLATSIKDFWRRWHITLSSWFLQYVYIPLGGNRNGKRCMFKNKMIVFLLTGLWHGASPHFIFWGIFHGALVCLEDCGTWFSKLKKRKGNRLYTSSMIMISFIFFRASSLTQAFHIIKAMFFPCQLYDAVSLTYCNWYFISMIVISLLLLKRDDKQASLKTLCVLFLCNILQLLVTTYHPFIYFQF